MNDEKIEKIQQELKQLSQKQVELERAHLQRVKSYKKRVQAFEQKVKDYEQQKSLYQSLFGQPPLQPDAELLVDPELSPDPEVVWRRFLKMKALAIAGLVVTGFTAFVQLKNRNRLNK